MSQNIKIDIKSGKVIYSGNILGISKSIPISWWGQQRFGSSKMDN